MYINPWKPNHFSSIYKQPDKIAIHNGDKTIAVWTFLLKLERYIEREKERKFDFQCRYNISFD